MEWEDLCLLKSELVKQTRKTFTQPADFDAIDAETLDNKWLTVRV